MLVIFFFFFLRGRYTRGVLRDGLYAGEAGTEAWQPHLSDSLNVTTLQLNFILSIYCSLKDIPKPFILTEKDIRFCL